MRKNILKYDDVLNDQRKVVFDQRRDFMRQENMRETIDDMRHHTVEDAVRAAIPEESYPDQWKIDDLKQDVSMYLNLDLPIEDWAKEEGIGETEIEERIRKAADEAYAARIERNTAEVMTYVERQVLLQTIDHLWREHIVTLDHLRQVIGWRGYAQRDPLNEYKAEAFELFDGLIKRLREQVTGHLMRVEVNFEQPADQAPQSYVEPVLRSRRRSSRSPAMMRSFRRSRAIRPILDLGAHWPQRALPVRIRQEIQALPRAVGVTLARRG